MTSASRRGARRCRRTGCATGCRRWPTLCLVLRDGDGTLAAAIRHWPVRVGAAPVLLLGPVAVHPTRQGEGLGGYLIHECLAEARKLGWSRVLLVGDAPYYGRFGFRKLADVQMPPPTNPDRVLGFALVPGAWEGVAGPVEKAEPPFTAG